MTDSGLRCPSCGHSSSDVRLSIPDETPRINKLLTSNDRPTQSEERHFQHFVVQGESEIQYLETRMAQVRGLFNNLKTELERATEAVKEYKSMLNPVRRLPFELLREIFLYGAGMRMEAGSHFASSSHSMDVASPPWVYGRVCSSWKEVTVRTPLLWTRIKVVANQVAPDGTRKKAVPKGWPAPLSFSLLSLFLSRSDGLPLTIWLDIWGPPSDYRTAYIHAASLMLFPSSRRWVSLFLAGGEAIPSTSFADDSFPLLAHIQSHEIQDFEPSTIRISAPNFQSWSTMGGESAVIKIVLLRRLALQITKYRVSRLSFDRIPRIIEQLPCLRELTVTEMVEKVARVPPRAAPALLESLSKLNLEQPSNSNLLDQFIDSITCPVLKDLSVTTPEPIVDAVQRLEARSNFMLERLDINAQAGLSMIKRTMEIKEVVVRDIGKAVDYDPFISLQDVLSHLSARPEHDSESSTTVSPTVLAQVTVANAFSPIDTTPSSTPDLSSDIVMSNGDSSTILPFPNLRSLELHFSTSPLQEDTDIMAEVFACVVSRNNFASERGNTGVALDKIFILAPDHQAKKMLNHTCLQGIRSMGVKVDILGL